MQVNYRSVLNGCLKAGAFKHLESQEKNSERGLGLGGFGQFTVSKYDSTGPQVCWR